MDHKTPARKPHLPFEPSEEDVLEAMKELGGFLDITPEDFKEIYRLAYRKVLEGMCQKVKAADIMTEEVIWVAPETPLAETAEIMARTGVSGLPVVNQQGVVEGIVSEKDFLRFFFDGKKAVFHTMDWIYLLTQEGKKDFPNLIGRKAREIMNAPVWTLFPETPLVDILNVFSEKKINRAPVVDRTGRLVGMVSRGDVIRTGWPKWLAC